MIITTPPEFELRLPEAGESILCHQQQTRSHPPQWHYHQVFDIQLIQRGSGQFFVGDYVGDFAPNQLVLVGPELPHCWNTNTRFEELSVQVIHFSGEMLEECYRLFPETKVLLPLLERARQGVEFYGEICSETAHFFQAVAGSQGLRRLSHFLALMERLAHSNEYRTLASKLYSLDAQSGDSQRVRRAVDYIHQHYDQELSLKMVAEHIGMTSSHFCRFFKQMTGTSFIEYLNQLRICEACKLLLHSDCPITQICHDAGFNNISNFNRRFYDIKGMTPSAYRKSYLKLGLG